MPSAAAQERWAILAAIPKVAEHKEAKRIFPPGTDFSVALNELPRASVLTVPPRLSLPAILGAYTYVAAADRSGLLLLCGTHPISSYSVMASYHICDARTGEAVSLPEPPRGGMGMAFHGGNVGLIVKGDDDGSMMVAGLKPGGGAVLLSYKVGDCRKWRERELALAAGAPPPLPKDWLPDCVVSHGGMLWWVDLAYGLLALDPFAEEPRLVHVPLPPAADELPAASVNDRVNRCARRCVRVSGGRLRCVQVHGGRDAPAVSTWALAESSAPAASCSGGEWEWNPERSVPLADFWIDAMLPLCVLPAVALFHPTDPDRVYFFLDSRIFGVDLRLRKLLGFNEFEMRRLPRGIGRKRSSRFVHAWQYDPSSTRSELVSTCLRQEKAISVTRSFSGFNPAMPATAQLTKRVWDSITRKQQCRQRKQQLEQQRRKREQQLEQQRRQQAMCHDFERRCVISEEGRSTLPHSSMNEG